MGNQEELLKQAFKEGWKAAAKWAKRDDLLADINSPAYERDCEAGLIAAKNSEQSSEKDSHNVVMIDFDI